MVDLYDVHTGRPYEVGIAMLDADPDVVGWNAEACAAAGPILVLARGKSELAAEVARVNELSASVNARVAESARAWIAAGKIVGVVGGDHAASFGAIQAHAERWPGLGILHFGAHADLRPADRGFVDSHASSMHNVVTRLPDVTRIVQVGLRDLSEEEQQLIRGANGRLVAFYDSDIARRLFDGETFSSIAGTIVESLPQSVYVSFVIDGLDPTLCPHTLRPVPGGLSFQQAVAILGRVAESGRTIVGFDLVDVVPGPDGDDWDESVGARILHKLIGFALRADPSLTEKKFT